METPWGFPPGEVLRFAVENPPETPLGVPPKVTFHVDIDLRWLVESEKKNRFEFVSELIKKWKFEKKKI